MNDAKALDLYRTLDPLTAAISPKDRTRLIAEAALERVESENEFYTPKTKAKDIFFVIDGEVRLVHGGQEISVTRGEYFGEEGALGNAAYLSRAYARRPSIVLRIALTDFRDALKTGVPEALVALYCARFVGVERPLSAPVEPVVDIDNTSVAPIAGWVLAGILPFILYFFPSLSGMDEDARLFLAILSSALCLWSFKLTADFVPGFFALLSALILGIAPREVILSGFSSDAFLWIFSLLVVASLFRASGIAYRLMLYMLKFMPPTPFWTNTSIFAFGGLLSTLFPSSATRGDVMAPFISDFKRNLELEEGGIAATRLVVTAYTSMTVFSPIFLTASLHNFVVLGLMWTQEQERFDWLGWLRAAMVPAVFVIGGFVLASVLLFQGAEKQHINRERIEAQLKTLGAVQSIEWAAILGVAGFLGVMALSPFLHIRPSYLAALVLLGLMIFRNISKETLDHQIEWSSLLLVSSLIGLVSISQHLGIQAKFIAPLSFLGEMMTTNFQQFILVVAGAVTVARLVLPYGPVVIIGAALLSPLAQQNGVNPWLVSFIVLMLGKCWIAPQQFPPYTNFITQISPKSLGMNAALIRFNLLMNLFKLGAILASIPFWRSLGLL